MLKLNKHLWDAKDTEKLRRRAAEERATKRRVKFPTSMSAASAVPAPLSVSSSSSSQQRFEDDSDGAY